MAAIDKLRTSNYGDYNEFRIWCIKHRPSLLDSFLDPFLSYKDWLQLHPWYDEVKIIIADFLSHEDRYLYWHCPLGFIREYLEKQCGYKKANRFVKLFWKY